MKYVKNTFQTAKPEAHLAKTGQSLSNTEGERGIVSTEHSVARGSFNFSPLGHQRIPLMENRAKMTRRPRLWSLD